MDKCKVKIAPKAIRELESIYEYIADEKLAPETKLIKQASNDVGLSFGAYFTLTPMPSSAAHNTWHRRY